MCVKPDAYSTFIRAKESLICNIKSGMVVAYFYARFQLR
jgi:hypothetical protein